jgi:hypothetical protein
MRWRRLRVAVLLVTALALGTALALEPNPTERIPNQQAGRLPYQLAPFTAVDGTGQVRLLIAGDAPITLHGVDGESLHGLRQGPGSIAIRPGVRLAAPFGRSGAMGQ